MVDRHDILGRSYLQCTECGEVFLYQESLRNYAQICSACINSICDEPWNRAFTLFRALRPDEDPQENGLGAKDPQANVTLSKHVEFGSQLESQFISFTDSIEVAAFFASRSERPRIAVFDAPEDVIQYFAHDAIPSYSRTARNFARIFSEYTLTEEEAANKLSLTRVLAVDPTLFVHFNSYDRRDHMSNFRKRYEGSQLSAMIDEVSNTSYLHVDLDVVGLQHYIVERLNFVTSIRWVFEDGNEIDNQAVRVDGRSTVQDPWVCVGYLSREHAGVFRFIYSNGNIGLVEVPNFTFTYDTVIRLKLTIPMQTEKRIRHSVHNVCGKASRIIDVQIG